MLHHNIALILLAACLIASVSSTTSLFIEVFGGKCFLLDEKFMKEATASNARQCAILCLQMETCKSFQYMDTFHSCKLYDAVYTNISLNSTSTQLDICASRTFYRKNVGYALYTSNGTFVVPITVKFLQILAIGGGSGGCSGCGGGGSSGFVAYTVLSVSSNQQFNVTVGSGGRGGMSILTTGANICNGATNGGKSTFGDALVANGGKASTNDNGGAGGSGGGAGTTDKLNFLSGGGGSAGNAGQNNNDSSFVGGSGQGASFTYWFSSFHLTSITAGFGAAGKLGNYPFRYGGGGGGGILLNGTGPNSGGSMCLSSIICGPGVVTGFGAGGSAGSRKADSNNSTAGGSGADGMVYIEYY